MSIHVVLQIVDIYLLIHLLLMIHDLMTVTFYEFLCNHEGLYLQWTWCRLFNTAATAIGSIHLGINMSSTDATRNDLENRHLFEGNHLCQQPPDDCLTATSSLAKSRGLGGPIRSLAQYVPCLYLC